MNSVGRMTLVAPKRQANKLHTWITNALEKGYASTWDDQKPVPKSHRFASEAL